MGNLLNLDRQYAPLPNAPALTQAQDTFRIRMQNVPIAASAVQWAADPSGNVRGFLQTSFGEVLQFSKEEWLDWFDRSKAEYEYYLSQTGV